MKKSEFKRFYNQLSDEAKKNIVLNPYGNHPMSLSVIALEAKFHTKLGKKILSKM